VSDILIVEDDFLTRTNLIDLLKENGYNVFSAENGKKALEIAVKFLPDLIISDIMMPDMDGIELYNNLLKEPMTAEIPFIFLTARSEPLEIRLGMQLGADDYITKPYKALELLEVVNVRLNKRHQREVKLKTLTDNISLSLPHELRTPLVAIMGYSQLLREQVNTMDPSEIIAASERIEYAGKRLNTTIEKFLVYSEIEFTLNDRAQLKRIKKLFCEGINEKIKVRSNKTAQKYFRESEIRLSLVESMLAINETYLGYIIDELVDNACKFSEAGTWINIDGYPEKSNYVIEILDHGRGMSQEQILTAGAGIQFEKEYFQQSGVGLGLAIVKGLTDIHGGSFTILSRKNRFTVVKVAIPLYSGKRSSIV